MRRRKGFDILLDAEEIEIINRNLKNGFDVEIQHRKNGIAILREKKEVCKKSNSPMGNGRDKTCLETQKK